MPHPASPRCDLLYPTFAATAAVAAGHLPQPADGPMVVGKVGVDVTPEAAADAARYVALNILATVKATVGDLDKIKRVLKLTGFVNCTDGVAGQPAVVNGASNLFRDVLGERGVHARSAVGTNALPLNVPVEIEAIIELEEGTP